MSIVVDALVKTFDGQPAVNDVSFRVPSNKFFCIVGPSGCGKSTLLRLIAGLESPDRGIIALNDVPVVAPGVFVPPEERHVGVVFQSYALWPHLTVASNVAFPYEARGIARSKALRFAGEHLKTVSLDSLSNRRPEALSGGQRQRVALARCLAADAHTILMDEPLANLDPHLRGAMETELREFHDQSGVTTFYITHDQREAMALADVMAVMDEGQILQIGTPQEIYDRPQNAAVARFIGRGVLIRGFVTAGRARICDQEIPVNGVADGEHTVFVRPQNIVVGDTGWPVNVSTVHYRGGIWEVAAHGRGVDKAILLDLPRPVQTGEILFLEFRGGWIVPD